MTKTVPSSSINVVADISDNNKAVIEMKASRKRRLDHLTLDEKIKRKKLKNRVAAQTSRDRKKAHMDELEAEIKELQANNRRLASENKSLQAFKEKLTSENLELREQITNHQARKCCNGDQSLCVGRRPLNIGPAVPAVNPLPQGNGLQPAWGLKTIQQKNAIWKVLTFFIVLCQTSSLTSKRMNRLKNLKLLQQAYFMKQLKMIQENQPTLITEVQEQVANVKLQMKWWGRHQKNWNPVED